MSLQQQAIERIGLVVVVLGLVLIAQPVGASSKPHTTHGYGAPFSSWVSVHSINAADCPVDTCYGPIVASYRPVPEFSFISTARHRVVGYTQALQRGTPLLQAELEVAEQFPSDVSMASSVMVVRHDRYGHSCVVYDLYSKTLARLFGPKGPGDAGDSIGVELATLLPSGNTTYSPHAIDLAIVSPVYLDRSTNC